MEPKQSLHGNVFVSKPRNRKGTVHPNCSPQAWKSPRVFKGGSKTQDPGFCESIHFFRSEADLIFIHPSVC